MLSLIRALPLCGRSLQPPRFARLLKPHLGRTSVMLYRHLESREYATEPVLGKDDKTLVDNVMAKRRFNELGVQQLSEEVHSQVFSKKSAPPSQELIDLSIRHLTRHELYGKNTDNNPPISFKLPPLHGETLDEHFHKLGLDTAEPYLKLSRRFSELDVPPPPKGGGWVRQSGWTKYSGGTAEKVDFPEDEMLVFDVEVLYKESPFAIMACAASPTAWYAWLSPWILKESESPRHLIPLGDPEKERIIVGHNVGYDRARLKEEYNLKQTKFGFLDTMSLHVASNGMCSRQRPTWLKHRKLQKLREQVALDNVSADTLDMLGFEEEEAWIGKSSINSLQEVALFHCGVKIDKEVRDQFGILEKEGVLEKLDELLDYCAADVAITHQVYKKVLPNFLEVCPHPVSFAALRHLSSVILPVNKSWETYVQRAEDTYIEHSNGIQERLILLAKDAVKLSPDDVKDNEWLRQLNWEVKEAKEVMENGIMREKKNQKQPGMPKWYKDLFPKATSEMPKITVRSRVAPILLRLTWDGRPLIWSDKFGWVIAVPRSKEGDYETKPVVKCDMKEEKNETLCNDDKNVYFKLPHKDGPKARCVSPLAKSYLKYFEEGTLFSEYHLAMEALQMNAACSYWISARERIKGQMVVYESELGPGEMSSTKEHITRNLEAKDSKEKDTKTNDKDLELGIILPQLIPMGTVTRRAVERTWLTASNAKKNRVGSELKAMVKAPPGYVFVGSDVDSQELWIASLVGDAQFKLHGGNAIGFMTLEGTKAAATDLHSKTAKILGISRNNAKIFNYGRIYGAGVKFASTLLRQFNPTLPDAEADKISENLYKETKGQKTIKKSLYDRPFWRGGTESFVFNKLEEFANQDLPRTPVLGAGITEALRREYLSVNVFMPSRINWAIQSSGVDYLHLLVISMDHLIRRFELDARLAITVHDEIRYMVKEVDKYKVAMALQISNLWTRAMFSQQMGIEDLPQSCAYFSAIDIDSVLRKEVDMDCITPSQPEGIPPGESINMTELLEILNEREPSFMEKIANKKDKDGKLSLLPYAMRTPIMEQLQEGPNIPFLKAQNANDDELQEIILGLRNEKQLNTFSHPRNQQRPKYISSNPIEFTMPYDGGENPATVMDSMKWSPISAPAPIPAGISLTKANKKTNSLIPSSQARRDPAGASKNPPRAKATPPITPPEEVDLERFPEKLSGPTISPPPLKTESGSPKVSKMAPPLTIFQVRMGLEAAEAYNKAKKKSSLSGARGGGISSTIPTTKPSLAREKLPEAMRVTSTMTSSQVKLTLSKARGQSPEVKKKGTLIFRKISVG